MNINNSIISLLLLLLPLAATAQTEAKLSPEVGGRIAFSADKKIVKGLHISLEEELRFDNNFKSFDRFHTTLAVKYKVHRNVKLGIGYSLISPYGANSKSFKGMRHRVFADVTGTLFFGDWSLALKERLQMTHRTKSYNPYQNTTNALTLKSRLTLKYRGFPRVEPYAYFELRNFLNASVVVAAYDGYDYLTLDGDDCGDPGWFIAGHNGGYANRYRGAIGAEFRLAKQHSLDVYFMGDYIYDKAIDANSDGTELKSYTKERGFFGTLGVAYQFSF